MTGNLLTLQDARDYIHRYVDEGSCSQGEIDTRIAMCEFRLWKKPGLRLSRRRMRIRVQNQCFPLPIEVESIIGTCIDGTPARIFNGAYEFLASGPGDIDMQIGNSGYKNLQDLGEFATQFDIPVLLYQSDAPNTTVADAPTNIGYHLYAFGTCVEDCQKTITVRGLNQTSDEVYSGPNNARVPGEQLVINPWYNFVEGNIIGKWADLNPSAALFSQASRVYKPETVGPVCLYAVDEATNHMWLLSKMTPATTTPSYRRYRITNQGSPMPPGTAGGPLKDSAFILALVHMRYQRCKRTDDILNVQNLDALKCMSLALNAENRSDPNTAAGLEMQAVRLLAEEYGDREEANGTPIILDVEQSLVSGGLNRGYLY